MTAASFGRKGAGANPELAARRAAFLAQERARAQAAPAGAASANTFEEERPRLTERPYVPRKTIGTAYLLWFFIGGLSAHRFYLGFTSSAFVQLLLTPIGYALMMTKSPAGMIAVTAGAVWLLLDAILIPGMVTQANERARSLSLASTFG